MFRFIFSDLMSITVEKNNIIKILLKIIEKLIPNNSNLSSYNLPIAIINPAERMKRNNKISLFILPFLNTAFQVIVIRI